MGGIWVFAENQEDTLELLNKGQEIARALHEKLITFATSRTMAANYIAYGADQIYLLPPLTEKEAWGDYLYAIADEAEKLLPAIILIAGTMRGREMAARLAQKLNTGLCIPQFEPPHLRKSERSTGNAAPDLRRCGGSNCGMHRYSADGRHSASNFRTGALPGRTSGSD
jgi:hypothetical protein